MNRWNIWDATLIGSPRGGTPDGSFCHNYKEAVWNRQPFRVYYTSKLTAAWLMSKWTTRGETAGRGAWWWWWWWWWGSYWRGRYHVRETIVLVFISQNKPLSGYKRNYSDNVLGITVHKRRRLNISSGCFIDVGLCRLYTLTERTRGEHIPP